VYLTLSTAVNADRIREFREQAATDRLVLQARRARREAAAAEAILRRRLWPRLRVRRMAAAMTAQPVPADGTPDQWASALSVAAGPGDVTAAALGKSLAVAGAVDCHFPGSTPRSGILRT
jgi:hypothetical protein